MSKRRHILSYLSGGFSRARLIRVKGEASLEWAVSTRLRDFTSLDAKWYKAEFWTDFKEALLPSRYYHLFLCTGTTCEHQGAEEILQTLQAELKQNGLLKKTRITLCRCLGQCGNGPNMVIYPEGVWYGGLGEDEIKQIVLEHLIEGKAVQKLIQIPVD